MRLLALAMVTMFAASDAARAETRSGTLPGGARWEGEVPANWNGTLLLWSRGYSPVPGEPEVAPRAVRSALLAAGYGLAGSNYGAGGWSLEEAIPAQRATVRAFAASLGRPGSSPPRSPSSARLRLMAPWRCARRSAAPSA